MQRITNFIGGKQVEPVTRRYLDNVEPATGAVYSQVPDSDERDIESAVAAGEAAFAGWSRTPASQRCRVMLKLADLIERDVDRLARAETVDNGKPLKLARSLDIPRAAENFRFFATAILHFQSEFHQTDDVAINYTLRQPRGVAGVISPWNLPLYLLTWKVAPAMAAGNTVVAKPSEVTPMTAFLLTELCEEAGLPPGVLNVVHGLGATAGAELVRHPRVPTISFTGGTVTGAQIAATAAPLFKKFTLELGGKNPNVVFADADVDKVVRTSLQSSFSNQGQVCLCGSRILVEASMYETFVEKFVDATRSMIVGDPLEAQTSQGSLVSQAHMEKVLSYIQLAREEGGVIRCGGEQATVGGRCKNGFFVQPTVITGLGEQCRVNQEEIFGPVVTIQPFESEDAAVELANSTKYGLSASLWTRDVGRALRVAERITAGTVWVNCWLVRDLRVPFGGTKSSGIGREGGFDALRFFTEPKNVCIRVERDSG